MFTQPDNQPNQFDAVVKNRRELRAGPATQRLGCGVILIAMGVFLLLRIQFGIDLQNWWALFILLPAAGALGGAWSMYQQAGRFTTHGAGGVVRRADAAP